VAEPILTPPGGGEHFERDDRVITILAELPGLSALVIDFEPSFSVDPHLHDDHVDSFYVLEGEVEFTVGTETVRAGPGTFLAVPPGARHGFANPGPVRAKILNLHAPDAGFAGSIRGHKP
jgi:quercetin dioxygenase-like cupin family protein